MAWAIGFELRFTSGPYDPARDRRPASPGGYCSVIGHEGDAEQRKNADEHFYQAIRARYNVAIRLPADSAGKILAVR